MIEQWTLGKGREWRGIRQDQHDLLTGLGGIVWRVFQRLECVEILD